MKRFLSVLLLGCLLCSSSPAMAVGTSASSAILMEEETGRVLYEQDADTPRPVASITKLMTALVAVERQPDLSVTVPILREYTLAEGSSLYLREGEEVTLETLLYGLLLQSGNDAALAIAGFCAGDTETFVSWMNGRADDLGMTNTHFCNPNGLHEQEHYSTARDMAVLARACLANETLRTVMATKSIALGGRSFANHNKLLWRYEGCIGLKTGYTEAAGRTLVSAAQRDGMTLIAVTLNDGNDWADHAALFDYGFSGWKREQLAAAGTRFALVPVTGSLVRFVWVEYASEVVCVREEGETVTRELSLKETATAPVEQGTIAGSVTFFLNGEEIGSSYLVYSSGVPGALWSGGLGARLRILFSRRIIPGVPG